MTFWIITSILLVVAFIYIVYTKSNEGKFHTTNWDAERLKRHLYILPIVLLMLSVITFFYQAYITDVYGGSSALAVIYLLLCLAFLVCNIVFLGKQHTYSIKGFAIASTLLSLFGVILFWRLKLNFDGAFRNAMCSTSPIFGTMLVISQYNETIRLAHSMSAFILILVSILQFYYIRWISFYFRQESVFGYSKSYVDPNVRTDDVRSTQTQEHTQQTSVKTMADQLRELKKLLDSGILTQEEFEAEKNKILNS